MDEVQRHNFRLYREKLRGLSAQERRGFRNIARLVARLGPIGAVICVFTILAESGSQSP